MPRSASCLNILEHIGAWSNFVTHALSLKQGYKRICYLFVFCLKIICCDNDCLNVIRLKNCDLRFVFMTMFSQTVQFAINTLNDLILTHFNVVLLQTDHVFQNKRNKQQQYKLLVILSAFRTLKVNSASIPWTSTCSHRAMLAGKTPCSAC